MTDTPEPIEVDPGDIIMRLAGRLADAERQMAGQAVVIEQLSQRLAQAVEAPHMTEPQGALDKAHRRIEYLEGIAAARKATAEKVAAGLTGARGLLLSLSKNPGMYDRREWADLAAQALESMPDPEEIS